MGMFDLRDLFRGRTPQERIDALGLRPDLARAAVLLVADERVDAQVVRLMPLLEPDESVLMLVEGRYQRQMGLLMLSTRRVVFRAHAGASGVGPAAFALADLTDARADTGSMTGRILLRFADAVLEVDKMLGKLADQVVAAIQAQQDLIDEPAVGAPPGGTPPGGIPRDPLQELVDLRSRYAAGLLSTADYEAAKARLVEEI